MAEEALRRLNVEDFSSVCEADRDDYAAIDLDLFKKCLESPR
jgi:hypothetical protein